MVLTIRRGLAMALAFVLSASLASAQFSINNSRIPSGSPENNSTTENVDFGDVDLDGDWDVVMADGGDDINDQNRIWINQGGDQAGTIGNFEDDTASRFPAVSDDSRDIEFVDFDNDGDLDIYTSNTSTITLQGNRWWVNAGGDQPGVPGFYTDETAARWVNLGGTGSSIDPSQLVGGSFVDWSCDCDFGDLDNDGDMDLVHSTYGGDFDGEVPTRIFLNNGSGLFEEFNPSGFQLTGPTIEDGEPGLWCEGDQAAETVNTDGSFCDIATTALDIDLGDIDGDFDLDILHGARNEAPRMFANRLEGSTLAPAAGSGVLAFRDVTGLVFPSNYFAGTFGHYEQEMGDFDGDGDLDIYGLNWMTVSFDFDDIVMRNAGDGTFLAPVVLANSDDDDNEGDFMDYDNDGDLDLYIADFSGQDRLYENVNGLGAFVQDPIVAFFAVSLDADACDTDNDGDYDVLVAEDNFDANTFLQNNTNVPDTHAPYIPNVEDVGDQLAQPGPIPVRAQVYDNAPYYITWYNPTKVQIRANGCVLPSVDARTSGGQIFRADLPGNLFGNLSYRFVSEDEYGNRGTSAWIRFRGLGNILKAGDVGQAPDRAASGAANYGRGTAGHSGVPTLEALTVAFPGAPYYLAGRYAKPNTPFTVWITTAAAEPPVQMGTTAKLHVAGNVLASFRGRTNEEGIALVSLGELPADLPAGSEVFAQFAVEDGAEDRWAVSSGLRITSFE